MNFVSSSTFRGSLNKLTKRAESGYKSCHLDICNEFQNLSFENIFNKHFLIREMGDLRVIKIRIQNSDQNLSSAAGYRLIIVCNKKHDHIALVEVYPKRGKYSRIDLSSSEYKKILNEYGNELKNKTLKLHDINKELQIMEQKKSSNSKQINS